MSDEIRNQTEKAVDTFRRHVVAGLKQSAAGFSKGKKSMVNRGQRTGMVRTELKLQNSVGSKVRKSNGSPESITFQFERHGVFVQRGVSRGHKASNPREKTDWASPVLEQYVPDLADTIAEINANNVINLKQ